MRFARPVALLLIACMAFASGCLELVGQRFAIHYDSGKDELHVLIHYDGIHDSGNGNFGNGAEQVAEAVREGNLMILDWPLHLQPKKIAAAAAEQTDLPKEVLALAAAIPSSVEVTTLGWFKDPQDRVGGVQLVTIRKAKDFIAKANAAISAAILAYAVNEPEGFKRSVALIRKAAKDGHAWISIDGYSIKFSAPVHATEWARVKAQGLRAIIEQIVQTSMAPPENAVMNKKLLDSAVRGLTCMPVSYSEANGVVSLTLGDPKNPSTLRLEIGKEYKPNLEKAVEESAPRHVDDVLARLALGEKVDVAKDRDAALVAAILQWGPPEEPVRALMRVVRGKDVNRAAKAVEKLEAFAEKWNTDHGFPEAPKPGGGGEEYLDQWSQWYRQMIRFPLGADIAMP